MAERSLYLHIGTHKTGTTSIQALVTMNAAALASAGIYVPVAGRPVRLFRSTNVGHHNIAWELNAYRDFNPLDGTLAQLLDEIAGVASPAVLLSSEDFEWLHAKPQVLRDLAAAFRDIGYSAHVIVYLRAQAEYIQAVYVEGSKAGFLMNYRKMLDEVLETGTYIPQPVVVNRFEYAPLLDAYATAFGEDRMIVRGYYPRHTPDRLLREFLSIVGAGTLPFDALLKPAPLNPTPSMLAVLSGMYRAVAARNPRAPDPQTLASDCFPGSDLQLFSQRFDVMTDKEIRAIFDRFHADNQDVERRYGARVPFIDEADLPRRDAVANQTVARQRRLLDAALQRWEIT